MVSPCFKRKKNCETQTYVDLSVIFCRFHARLVTYCLLGGVSFLRVECGRLVLTGVNTKVSS